MSESQEKVILWIIDQESHAAHLLAQGLQGIDGLSTHVFSEEDGMARALREKPPQICLVNHYAHRSHTFDQLALMQWLSPQTAIIVLVSPGLARQQLVVWREQHALPSLVVLDKPLIQTSLLHAVREQVSRAQEQRDLHQRMAYLNHTQPSARWLETSADMKPGDAVLAEMTVLMTDIRQSTQHIVRQEAKHFLCALNDWLSLQTKIVYAFEGSVVKFTGDGLLAIFEGSAQKLLAVKCAQQILLQQHATALDTGIGIADGLVLGGLIGSDFRYQFDVTGETVHLAARLCSKANAWEAVVERGCMQHIALLDAFSEQQHSFNLRGFSKDISTSILKEKMNHETSMER